MPQQRLVAPFRGRRHHGFRQPLMLLSCYFLFGRLVWHHVRRDAVPRLTRVHQRCPEFLLASYHHRLD